MTRRWWGGPGISVMLHAGLLLALIYVAAQPSRIDATAAVASRRMKAIYTATPGLGVSRGGGADTASAPRPARVRDSRPLDTVAPPLNTNVEPLPAAAVPAITMQGVDVLPGTPMVVDGTTVGRGSGPGGGGGRGPGNGLGAGPGTGDVYDAGVGGVSDPRLIHEVKPSFTDAAMRAKIQGVVIINVVVLADGSVDPARIRITRSLDPGLDQQAVIAVRQWRFRPSLRMGQPVTSRVTVELTFTLR